MAVVVVFNVKIIVRHYALFNFDLRDFDEWVKVTRWLPTHSMHSWVNFYANQCYDTKSHTYYPKCYYYAIDPISSILIYCRSCCRIGRQIMTTIATHSSIKCHTIIIIVTCRHSIFYYYLRTLQLFSLFFFYYSSLDMAQDVFQVYRMQHGTQHENIQGLW